MLITTPTIMSARKVRDSTRRKTLDSLQRHFGTPLASVDNIVGGGGNHMSPVMTDYKTPLDTLRKVRRGPHTSVINDFEDEDDLTLFKTPFAFGDGKENNLNNVEGQAEDSSFKSVDDSDEESKTFMSEVSTSANPMLVPEAVDGKTEGEGEGEEEDHRSICEKNIQVGSPMLIPKLPPVKTEDDDEVKENSNLNGGEDSIVGNLMSTTSSPRGMVVLSTDQQINYADTESNEQTNNGIQQVQVDVGFFNGDDESQAGDDDASHFSFEAVDATVQTSTWKERIAAVKLEDKDEALRNTNHVEGTFLALSDQATTPQDAEIELVDMMKSSGCPDEEEPSSVVGDETCESLHSLSNAVGKLSQDDEDNVSSDIVTDESSSRYVPGSPPLGQAQVDTALYGEEDGPSKALVNDMDKSSDAGIEEEEPVNNLQEQEVEAGVEGSPTKSDAAESLSNETDPPSFETDLFGDWSSDESFESGEAKQDQVDCEDKEDVHDNEVDEPIATLNVEEDYDLAVSSKDSYEPDAPSPSKLDHLSENEKCPHTDTSIFEGDEEFPTTETIVTEMTAVDGGDVGPDVTRVEEENGFVSDVELAETSNTGQVAALKAIIAEEEDIIATLKKDLAEANEDRTTFKKQLLRADVDGDYKKLAQDCKELKEKLSESESAKTRLAKDLARTEFEKNQLFNEYNTLADGMMELNSIYAEVHMENDSLKKQLKENEVKRNVIS